ncbi:MAG: type I 3-dehydroquinate dehydratase [Firmicutes bacterium]|nr:type I 3-dehydroquinate dehydratase [Bacillota bacterium]
MSHIKKVEIKGRVIGGTSSNICVPLISQTMLDLLAEARALTELNPELMEWRVDYFNYVENTGKVLTALDHLREMLWDYPLIATCRDYAEGGFAKIPTAVRVALLRAIIRSGNVDFVDVEFSLGMEIIEQIVYEAHQNNIYVIVSTHDFAKTPSLTEMIALLQRLQASGADIVKMAVMPNHPQDVLDVLTATLQFTEQHAHVPVVTMSMSQLGVISRIAGSLFGSAITFAAGQATSAPGQLPFLQVKAFLQG